MDIIYISKNKDKFNESKRLFDAELKCLNLEGNNINLVRMQEDFVEEIQTEELYKLVDDKIRKAYDIYKRPVLIEHTVLQIDCLNGYPNTQTSGFWNTICKNETIPGQLLCKMVEKLTNNEDEDEKIKRQKRKVIAKTIYCYCDGKNVIKAEAEVEGVISNEPKGNSKFQWDVIFIPNDKAAENKTFAELEEEKTENGTRKDLFSMRAKAMEKFISELKDKYNEKEYNIGLDSEHIKSIANSIIEKKLVVFVGAGVSASIKLANWNKLIEDLGKELDFKDEKIFASLGDNLELAEYYSLENDNMVDQIVKYFKSYSNISEIEKNIKNSEIYRRIVNFNIDTIYTTNYEDAIEKAFNIHNPGKKYNVIYDLETLNKSKTNDIEIVKLHGDLNNPQDIVLTQTSYYKRYDFENCLDIKLRNDLLTKSVLFIGYSFRDPNIKYMMHKLNSIWEKGDIKHRPKSYIFLTENNPVQREIIEKNNNMITLVTENLDKTKALEEFLFELESKINMMEK